MTQLVIRNIETTAMCGSSVARKNDGWSMKEEMRHILRKAVAEQGQPPIKLGSWIAARFAGAGLSGELRQLQGQAAVQMNSGT